MAQDMALIFLCLVLGGIIKGATGAGAPLFAIPAITALFDIRLAVVAMIMPNIVSNVWQVWRFHDAVAGRAFLRPFLISSVVGAILGTWALAVLPLALLSLLLCIAALAYVIFRLMRPHWVLGEELATILAVPAGGLAGLLQGASGVSAPASLTYLSSLRLPREQFAGAVSMLFLAIGITQIPALWIAGLVDGPRLAMSAAAVIPLALGMLGGNWLAKFIAPERFQNLILLLVAALAFKLLFDILAPYL